MESILDKFNTYTEKPAKFLTVQSDIKDDIKSLVKSLYDFTKTQEHVSKKKKLCALPELIVKDFDEEQIWQQLELQNSECWDQFVWDVANSISSKNDLTFPVTTTESIDSNKNEDSDENDSADEEGSLPDDDSLTEDQIENTDVPLKKKASTKTKVKKSIVDDKFFKLQEMEQFLLHEEKKLGKEGKVESDSEESIDLFQDIDDDDSEDEEGGKEAKYTDFFNQEDNENDLDDMQGTNEDIEMEEELEEDAPAKRDKKVRFAVEDDESSSDEPDNNEIPLNNNNNKVEQNEKKSEFELRQQRLKKHIEKLEEKTMNEAPWQLKGEVDALKRPQNSLLEEVVDFDLTSRPPPIITEQTTVTLEDIIRRRIKDKAWDDVVKKEKPVDDQLSFRKTEVLDHAKSKLSLAQVYEAEYLKQKQALTGEPEEETEPEAHTEIRNAVNSLFAKLDALCHYHYTPTAPQPEVKIVSNTPAISMEEVAPVATSDAALLAPEEVKRKRKGDLMSKDERTQTDKNRERRKKKKLQREKGGTVKVTEHRNTTKGAEAEDKSLKTSKAFFQQLNDNSNSLIKKKNNAKNKRQ